MRLWTVQPNEVYEIILADGVYRCDSEKSECIKYMSFTAPYKWLAKQMKKHIGPPPDGVTFPVWAWHTVNWKNKRPDMRWAEFRSEPRPFVLMEIEIPDGDVLLSDEELWHFVLNDCYLSDAENEDEYDEDRKRFELLSEEEKQKEKEESWERIFAVSPPIDNGWERAGCYIQATFWELHKEQIVKVWRYK